MEIEQVLRVVLSQRQAGKLIGRRGETIENIRKKFNADITISTSGSRIVTISGKQRVNVYCLILTQIL